jgi:hypothetical protein
MNHKTIKHRNTLPVIIFVSILIISLEGCSAVEVKAVQSSKADDIFSKTVVALWWGGGDPLEEVDCSGNGLQFVRVKSSWLYSLCTVVTLGAVAPFDIEYRCTSVPMQDGGEIGGMEVIIDEQ